MANNRESYFAKPMTMVRTNRRLDLSIERDAGNPVLILMGGNKKGIRTNWRQLKNLADKALREVEELE